MEAEVTRWIIILLGAVSISMGLGTRLTKTDCARDMGAVTAYTSAGQCWRSGSGPPRPERQSWAASRWLWRNPEPGGGG